MKIKQNVPKKCIWPVNSTAQLANLNNMHALELGNVVLIVVRAD
jgi:hypothetical protein